MYQILVFTNNCIIIFYTLYLLRFNCANCLSNNNNYHSWKFPTLNRKVNPNLGEIKSSNANNMLNKRKLGKFCIINNEFITFKPVQISVNTFWGKDSQFNSNFVIRANLNDTFQTVKDFVFKKTGIPAVLQQLYINTNSTVDKDDNPDVRVDKLIKVNNSDKLNKYLNYCKVSKLKEFELNLLLDLPAPVYKNMKPDIFKIEEYVSGLIKYIDLLNSVNNISLNTKRNDKTNIDLPLSDSISYGLNLHGNFSKFTDSDNSNSEDDMVSIDDADNCKNTSVKKVYIRLFEDFPPDTHIFNKRLNSIINYYFPLNTSATVKFTLFCLLLRLNKGYNKAVLDAFILMPLIAVIIQTRPGIFLNKLLFHLLASQIVPKIFYNLLPAHLAQKFYSNRN